MIEMRKFLDDYFDTYKELAFDLSIYEMITQFKEAAIEVRSAGKKLMFAGNGASAAISAHGAVDFTKQAKVRSVTFNEANLITCFANDYGYDNWMAESVRQYGDAGDIAVLISVSGKSPSVVKAAEAAKAMGLKVVTFTGRRSDNPLKQLGDINFWVDCHAYNVVECIHMIWITATIDAVIEKAEYETSSLSLESADEQKLSDRAVVCSK